MKNKKSMVQFTLIGIIITVITFFLIGSFLFQTEDTLTSSTQDIACRTFLSAKDSTITKLTEEFIGVLNQRCQKDEVTYFFEDKKKTFESTSNLMQKCWYRYGEGRYDFLSNVNTQGNWCFTCAKLNFRSGGDIYDYNEFIDYLKNQEISVKNETGEEVELSVFEYVNVQYVETNAEEMYNIKGEIEAILVEDEPALEPLVLQANDEYQYIMDLRLKEISTQEPMYIVYRYDIPNSGLLDGDSQAMMSVMGGMALGLGAGIIATFAVETVTYAAIGTLIGGPIGTAIGGGIGLVVGLVKKGIKAGDKFMKLFKKINEIRSSLFQMKQFSKLTETSNLINNNLNSITHNVEDIPVLVDNLKDFPQLARKYENFYNDLKELDVKNIDDLDNLIDQKKISIENVNKVFDRAVEMMNDDLVKLRMKDVERLVNSQKGYEGELNKLIELRNEMEDIGKFSKITEEQMQNPDFVNKIKQYLRYSYLVVGTVAGGMIGNNLDFYEFQYVDIMTQEQYYRLCGTYPYLPN